MGRCLPDTVPLESGSHRNKICLRSKGWGQVNFIARDRYDRGGRIWIGEVLGVTGPLGKQVSGVGQGGMVDARFELVRARSTGLTSSKAEGRMFKAKLLLLKLAFNSMSGDGEGDEVGFRIGKRMTVPSVEFPTQGGACVQVYGILKNRGEREGWLTVDESAPANRDVHVIAVAGKVCLYGNVLRVLQKVDG